MVLAIRHTAFPRRNAVAADSERIGLGCPHLLTVAGAAQASRMEFAHLFPV